MEEAISVPEWDSERALLLHEVTYGSTLPEQRLPAPCWSRACCLTYLKFEPLFSPLQSFILISKESPGFGRNKS